MYIKKVIIQGFRSYRDQTCPGEFSPHHNIIVGRNGSGKSNFFQAIQFVLSDEYSHLSPQERVNLLHEGTGPRVISAYVEIIFDNSDNRIPFDKTEVSLRRIIGSKKDQYFLDKKMVTKADVMNLLESAGFSRSNPYYIVKQGKITQLATAPDNQRLKLLREVAGTRVYDERKEESKQIFKESEAKMEQINELLSSIDERLSTLESETKELKEYQKCDRDRRGLEYTIYDRELKEIKKKLDDIKEKREQSSVNTLDMRRSAKKCADEIEKCEREYRDLRLKETQMVDELEQINSMLGEKLQRREQLQLTVSDYTVTKKGGASARARAQKDLERVSLKIKQVEMRLEEIKPMFEAARAREDEMANSLSDAEHRRKELFAKQGRVNQFQSRTQRDDWIKEQMKSLNKAIRDKENTIKKLGEEIDTDSVRSNDLNKELNGAEENMESVRQELEIVSEELRKLRREKDEVQADRQTVYRQESKVQQQLNNLRDELNRTEHNLRSIIGKGILNGLDSVRKVVEIFREKYGADCPVVTGYYGTMIELINCPDTFYTSVEVTAGTRLFYHVVDNEELVIKILQEVNKHNLPGEINFFPINRLHAKDSVYPETNDAIPMMSRLTFDAKFNNVMLHNFGKTLVCRTIEIASRLAKDLKFDCITLDGDQVSRRGTLTGGYYDQRLSRLELQKRKQKMEMEIDETENVQQNYVKRKENLDARINEIIDKLQRKETIRSKHEMTFDKLKKDIHLWKEELHTKVEGKPQKEWKLTSLRHDLEQMKYTRESYQVELGTDLLSQLSANEQREVDRLNKKIQELTGQAKDAYSERMNLESEKTENESLLYHNLMRKKDQLEAEMTEVSETDIGERLQEAEDELKAIDERVAGDQQQLGISEEKLAELQTAKNQLETQLDAARQKEKDFSDNIQEDQQNLEKMQSKQSQLLKKKEETLRKIRDVGSLPADALDKFSDKNLKQLFKLLDKANREIKRYSHVNKKALDQFVSYNEEKEKLLKRKEELDKGHQSIMDLMKALDHQKYEAIVMTFKQVSKYFQEIFKKLVPDGRAELIIRRGKMTDPAGGTEGDEDEDANIPEVEKFTGIGIEVSFTGGDAQMKDMNQLSGGQKSLVALTLIFAIQKCDPAPFYLFDEIDAALDPQYRKAVADMIKGLSNDAQFITTTFRAEMLEASNRFYGVKFRNKVSHIDQVSKEEALDFVEDDQTHG